MNKNNNAAARRLLEKNATCEQCREFMLEYMDEALTTGQAAAVEKHLHVCEACAHLYCEQEEMSKFLGDGMKKLTSSLSMPPLTVRLRQPRYWMIQRAAAVIIIALVPFVIWLMVSAPTEPGNPGFQDLTFTHQHAQPPSDVMFSDSLADWHDRKLVITVSNREGKITEQIVTSN